MNKKGLKMVEVSTEFNVTLELARLKESRVPNAHQRLEQIPFERLDKVVQNLLKTNELITKHYSVQVTYLNESIHRYRATIIVRPLSDQELSERLIQKYFPEPKMVDHLNIIADDPNEEVDSEKAKRWFESLFKGDKGARLPIKFQKQSITDGFGQSLTKHDDEA